MLALKNLEDLFEYELIEMFCGEKQLIDELPKLISRTKDPQLKEILNSHLQDTIAQKERLNSIFNILGIVTSTNSCQAMKGIIEEMNDLIDEEASAETKDAGIILTIQKVKHYEIACYGTAAQYAETLGLKKQQQLLEKSLEEEKAFDEIMNKLAKSYINQKAIEETA